MIKFRYAENGNEIVNTEFSSLFMYEENVWTFFPQQRCIYLLMCLAQYVKEIFYQSQIIMFHHHINYNVACNACSAFAIQKKKVDFCVIWLAMFVKNVSIYGDIVMFS